MKLEDFNKVVERRVALIKEVLTSKGQEYVRGDDRLHNFKNSGRKKGVTPEKALTFFMLKHETSLDDIINDLDRGIIPTQKMIDEKIGDIINYYILLEAHFAERIAEVGNAYEKTVEGLLPHGGSKSGSWSAPMPSVQNLPKGATVLGPNDRRYTPAQNIIEAKADEICEQNGFGGVEAPLIKDVLIELLSKPVVVNLAMWYGVGLWASRCEFTEPLKGQHALVTSAYSPYDSICNLKNTLKKLQS